VSSQTNSNTGRVSTARNREQVVCKDMWLSYTCVGWREAKWAYKSIASWNHHLALWNLRYIEVFEHHLLWWIRPKHGRNFVVKCRGTAWCETNILQSSGRWWSKFYKYRFSILFLRGVLNTSKKQDCFEGVTLITLCFILAVCYRWFTN